MTTIPRLVERLFQAALGSDRAATAIGDLQEDLMRLRTAHASPASTRYWLVRQLIGLAGAAVSAAAPRAIRRSRQTIHDAIRGLRASPATTVFAVVILTLGMAAATVTFSVVDHVVLRPLAFPDDDRLVAVYGSTPRGRSWIVAPQDYFAWREGVEAFEHLAAWSAGSSQITIASGDTAERVPSLTTTASLFDVLRVRPMLGRTFGSEHEVSGQDKVVLLSHALWQRRFLGDPAVVGRTIAVGGTPHEILGVMPPGSEFPVGIAQPTEIWRPYVPRPEDRVYVPAGGRGSFLRITGRLRDAATLEQASAQVDAVIASLRSQNTQLFRNWQVEVGFLRDALVSGVRGWLLLVLWAVALVLIVACVNVANLLLTRSTVRARDFAVRASLGATRFQLTQALIVESVLLSLVAGIAGVLVAWWSLDLVKATLPEGISRASLIALDWRVLGAAFTAAIGTGLVFGTIPAWQASRADIIAILKAGTPSTSGSGKRRWRSRLLIAQVGLVVVLLVATSLLVASFVRIMRADLGFARENLIGVRASLSWPGLPPAERSIRSRQFFRQAAEVLERLPGVARVAHLAGAELPLFMSSAGTTLSLPDATDSSASMSVEFRRVSEGYFEAAGIRVLAGRAIRESDRDTAVVVLDEIAATRLFGASPAVGSSVRVGSDATLSTVIGVVANVRLVGPEGEQLPQMYQPWSLDGVQGGSPMIVIRTSRPAADMVPVIKTALMPVLPPGNRMPEVTVVDDLYRRLTADRRFNAGLMLVFGALALLIGAAGIYSVMASVVAQQTREIGIRCALGATRSRIAAVVLSDAGRQVGIGLAIGLLAAWAVSGIFASVLFGVRPTEPALYVLVMVVLAVVALAAAWIPARRASRVDPIVALRE